MKYHLVVDLRPTSRSDLTGRKSIWSYFGHIFTNSIFFKFFKLCITFYNLFFFKSLHFNHLLLASSPGLCVSSVVYSGLLLIYSFIFCFVFVFVSVPSSGPRVGQKQETRMNHGA
jgi:hypothetical protein